MRYGIYKNEWSSAAVNPFTTITGDLMLQPGLYGFFKDGKLLAIYPTSHFYVVALDD